MSLLAEFEGLVGGRNLTLQQFEGIIETLP